MEPNYVDLAAVLKWLAVGGGSVALCMWAFSWIAENVKAWGEIPGKLRALIPIAVSCLVAIGADAAIKYTDFIAYIQPYWQIIAMTILGWLASQKAYQSAKQNEYGARFRVKWYDVDAEEDVQ